MSKFSEKYGVSTVTIPEEEKEKYKSMNIEKNTQFLEYINKRIKDSPDVLDMASEQKMEVFNFKFHKRGKPIYEEIKKKLKEYKDKNAKKPVRFSNLYRLLFEEFITSVKTEEEKLDDFLAERE